VGWILEGKPRNEDEANARTERGVIHGDR